MEQVFQLNSQQGQQNTRVRWIPLFASTQCIYGVILAKIRGVHMYRRIGAVEISTLGNYPADEVGTLNKRKESQTERERPPAGSSVG